MAGRLGAMRLLGLGLLAEIVVFAAVADWLGFGTAVALTFASSLLGAAMLRHLGLSTLASLRRFGAGSSSDGLSAAVAREGVFTDGMLGALGAVLLLLPGFLSDLVGLALLAPSGRQWVARRLGMGASLPVMPRRGGTSTQTIELATGEFTRLDKAGNR